MSRRSNGEGSIYQRQDGRWEGALYVNTTAGSRKRLRVYGNTRTAIQRALLDLQSRNSRGLMVADHHRRLADYLDYWLTEVVTASRRPSTAKQYAWVVHHHLQPDLGTIPLDRLTVATVQQYMNDLTAAGWSTHRVRLVRLVLSAALTRAQREELLDRNVARLVELPSYQAAERVPWTAEEAQQFLREGRQNPLYPAYLLLLLYGLRRGELLGLRWGDIDLEHDLIRVRSQLQRLDGTLRYGPVKTQAGQRDLPLIPLMRTALLELQTYQRRQAQEAGKSWVALPLAQRALLTTGTGRPLDVDKFPKLFKQACKAANVRTIRVHDIRHTTATLLKNLGVPARDAQLILGHADIATTQQIYQHDDMTSRGEALAKVGALFLRTDGSRCRQVSRQVGLSIVNNTTSYQWYPAQESNLQPSVPEAPSRDLRDALTSVKQVMRARTKWRLCGLVAVNLAVRTSHAGMVSAHLICSRSKSEGGVK